MELYKELLVKALEKGEVHVLFPSSQLSVNEIVEMQCYQALQEIKAIIDNDALSDFECIEEIVRLFERIGSNGGSRHDF